MAKLIEKENNNFHLTDDDVYAINPFFRLRNEEEFVVFYGKEGRGNYRLHRTHAIILALCDGEKKVGDIVRSVTPFVNKEHSVNRVGEAKKHVYKIISTFKKSYDEQQNPNVKRDPSQAALISVSNVKKMSPAKPPVYDAKDFLPKSPFLQSDNDYQVRERVPSEILWHVTSDCATDCQYCYLKRRKIPQSNLVSKERMLELLAEAKQIGVFSIEPSGGDILLYPYLFDFLDAITEHEFMPVRISTKAYLSKETAKHLAEYPTIFEIQFSMDSTVAEVADYLTQTPGFHTRTEESIRNALETGLKVATKAVITPYNVCTIPRLYRDLKNIGVGDIRTATYCRSAYHHKDRLFNHIEDYDWLDKKLDVLKKEFPDDQIGYQNGRPMVGPRDIELRQEAWKGRTRCAAGRTSFLICADGKVIPCEQLPENEEMFVGDLTTQSIEEVWNSKKLLEKTIYYPKEKFKNTICYECEEIDNCHTKMGYCIRDTYHECGTIYEAAPGCPKSDRFVRKF